MRTLIEAARYLGISEADLNSARILRQVAYTKLSPSRVRFSEKDLDAFRATWQRFEVATNAVIDEDET